MDKKQATDAVREAYDLSARGVLPKAYRAMVECLMRGSMDKDFNAVGILFTCVLRMRCCHNVSYWWLAPTQSNKDAEEALEEAEAYNKPKKLKTQSVPVVEKKQSGSVPVVEKKDLPKELQVCMCVCMANVLYPLNMYPFQYTGAEHCYAGVGDRCTRALPAHKQALSGGAAG